ncbi:MAG: ATP-binding cassette domain-containing protein [Bifidobacterium sp.]|uniref:ATP-binding cassette domain-containing protein n=1 Tax=Bifidobacterium fermentum TaxID=3059035 RepID=A0AB39UH82_9BIFI
MQARSHQTDGGTDRNQTADRAASPRSDAGQPASGHSYAAAGDVRAGVAAPLSFRNWGYRHASRRNFSVRNLNLEIHAGERVLLLGASGIGKSTILEGAAGLLGVDAVETSPVKPMNSDVDSNSEGDAVRDSAAPMSESGDRATELRQGSSRLKGQAGHRQAGQDATQLVDSDGGTTEGAILVGGQPVSDALGRVGLVLQDPDAQAIFQRLGDNVAFGPENMNVPRAQIWQRVRQCLHEVGLDDVQLHRSTMHLSGGQMQRLALAGAIAMRPEVLLLDEPTANLDPDGVEQIVAAVRKVVHAQHSTMVLVEHRAEPWIDMIDRVIVLGLEREGSEHDDSLEHDSQGDEISRKGFRRTVVVADGTPEEVFGDETLDFEELGIWMPKRFRKASDEIHRMHTQGESDESARIGTGTTILSTEDLSVGRNGQAIASHIDLAFAKGQITALVGANGVGKSTLSMTLAGLLKPVDGAVKATPELVGGLKSDDPFAWKSTDLASRISYVFQNPEHQFAKGTVLDEVMLAPLKIGYEPAKAEEIGRRLLARFALLQYAKANPYTLSGGEKRRLTVASALAAAPRVLLLDEPTFGQDRRTWMQIVRYIDALRSDGVCVIVVTHDRDMVTALGARVVELIPASSHAEKIWQAQRQMHGALPVPEEKNERGTQAEQDPRQGGQVAGERRAHRSKARQSLDDVIPVSDAQDRREAPRQSSHSRFIASLNPAIRLIGAMVLTIPLLLSLDWVSASSALGLELVFFLAAGLSPWRILKYSWPIFLGAPGAALAVLLYGKVGGDSWWQWGLIHITDRSATLAVATAIRILAIGIPAIIMVFGIDATDLADAFTQILHLPDRFVYGGLAGIRLFSVLQDDWAALTSSRRSRGLGDENAVAAFFPQAFALLVLSIRRSTMLATAMETRGFGSTLPRSHARVSRLRSRDALFIAMCVAIPALALTLAALAGSYVFLGGN